MDNRWEDEETQSEAQMHTQAIEAGWSSTEDPETCGCHGGGWILSQLDTFHKCPIHFADQRHPEDDSEDDKPKSGYAPVEYVGESDQEPTDAWYYDNDRIPF